MTFSDIMSKVFQRRCIEVREPMPGHRHNRQTVYVFHRFEVKGGITPKELMIRQMEAPNQLLEGLRRAGRVR